MKHFSPPHDARLTILLMHYLINLQYFLQFAEASSLQENQFSFMEHFSPNFFLGNFSPTRRVFPLQSHQEPVGHSLGFLRDSDFCQFSRKHQTYSSLDLPRSNRGLLVVVFGGSAASLGQLLPALGFFSIGASATIDFFSSLSLSTHCHKPRPLK